MTYRFKRGEIIRANCDLVLGGDIYVSVGKTYVVNARSKSEYKHTYVTVLGDDNTGHEVSETEFSKIKGKTS